MKKWNVQTIVLTAMLAGLAGALMSLEFSLPMMPPFYKIDFSDVPSIIALFSLGPVSATLVEVENVEQLANAIIDILKDRKKFDREYIAKYVKDNHSQDVLTQELIDVYEQALNL